ncbi:hypothetical protein [Mycobacterium sp. AZCC_0083]|uniref:hypothetical protein n=1 Tax=Mycobacterium sp. AZCC_0083 TaxID=2735882 RepID=UPI00161C0019|nr:hypothetical protein [Mycobacterium sp. AZCC_0083]MBB5167117.1 hypothetical protein [Mycobacterium sp. AZCC_0083]
MTVDPLPDFVYPKRGDQRRMTIIGDRQSGKTYTLLERAVSHARQGEIVVFDCETLRMAQHTHSECLNTHVRWGSDDVSYRASYQDITLDRHSFRPGRIIFRPHGRRAPDFDPKAVDVHLLDCSPNDLVYKSAKLVIRAVHR